MMYDRSIVESYLEETFFILKTATYIKTTSKERDKNFVYIKYINLKDILLL